MGYETEHLKSTGFASHRVEAQPQITSGHVSYAQYLGAAVKSYMPVGDPSGRSAEPRPDRRSRPLEAAQPHIFPSISVIRRFDRSRANAQWRKFEGRLQDRAERVGMQALSLSELRVVLIPEDNFQSAMEKRYDYAAKLAKGGLRRKESRKVAADSRRFVTHSANAHHENVTNLTGGRTTAVERRSYFDMTDDEIYEAGQTMDKSPEEVVVQKADGLWQPYSAQINELAATGPRTVGVVLDDSLGILRTEAETIGHRLSAKSGHDFDMSCFRVAKSFQFTLDLVKPALADLSKMPELQFPELPYDMPLLPPQVITENSAHKMV